MSSRSLETRTMVSRTTTLYFSNEYQGFYSSAFILSKRLLKSIYCECPAVSVISSYTNIWSMIKGLYCIGMSRTTAWFTTCCHDCHYSTKVSSWSNQMYIIPDEPTSIDWPRWAVSTYVCRVWQLGKIWLIDMLVMWLTAMSCACQHHKIVCSICIKDNILVYRCYLSCWSLV